MVVVSVFIYVLLGFERPVLEEGEIGGPIHRLDTLMHLMSGGRPLREWRAERTCLIMRRVRVGSHKTCTYRWPPPNRAGSPHLLTQTSFTITNYNISLHKSISQCSVGLRVIVSQKPRLFYFISTALINSLHVSTSSASGMYFLIRQM